MLSRNPLDRIKNTVTKLLNISQTKKQVLLISFLLLITKFFGLIRQSYVLGLANSASIQSDIFVNSTRIQDLVISFLLSATIISTLIPLGTKYESKEVGEFNEWIREIFISINILMFTVVTFLLFNIDSVISIFVGQNNNISDYRYSLVVLLVGVIFFGWGIFYQSFLNLKNKFFWQNTMGLVTNLFVITAINLSSKDFGVYGSVAITLSFLTTSLMLAISAHRNGLSFQIYNLNGFLKTGFKYNFKYIKEFSRSSLPKLFLISPFLISGLILQRFGLSFDSTYYETSLNILNIYGIFLISLGLVALPKFSKDLVNLSLKTVKNQIRSYVGKSSKYSLYITLLMFLVVDLVLILLTVLTGGMESLKFDSSYWLVSNTSKILCLTILPQTINEVLYKYFLARDKSSVLLISNLIMIVSLGLWYLLFYKLGFNSLYSNATSTVISYYIMTYYLSYRFKKDK